MAGEPKWRRRKTARPAEIVAAALEEFADKGFAAAKLEDIARRAGVSKAAIYVYYDTKAALFRAVARATTHPGVDEVVALLDASEGPFADLAPAILAGLAGAIGGGRAPAVARMVIAEAGAFPDLARIWHDDVAARVIDAVSAAIARAQGRGEVIEGDPRLHALSLLGPVIMAALFGEVFAAVAADPPDPRALAVQHARTALHGLLAEPH